MYSTRGPMNSIMIIPDDIVLLIIYDCKAGDKTDRTILSKLYTLCKRYHRVMEFYRKSIINHYTVIETNIDSGYTHYMFCGEMHRDDDKPASVSDDGSILMWYQHGKLHRDGNLPAVIEEEDPFTWSEDYITTEHSSDVVIGKIYEYKWYQRGVLHRDGDQPAVISDGGRSQEWYQHGKLHRDGDQYAKIYHDDLSWYQHGELYREDDKPAVIDRDYDIEWDASNVTSEYPPYTIAGACYVYEWYQHGQLHREGDLPAIISDNGRTQEWYQHGLRHRDDGKPATVEAFGDQVWYTRGIYKRHR